MHRTLPKRRHRPDLIARPPLGGVGIERRWASLIIDPVHQLRALADLHERDLISTEEYAAQRRLVLVETYDPDGP